MMLWIVIFILLLLAIPSLVAVYRGERQQVETWSQTIQYAADFYLELIFNKIVWCVLAGAVWIAIEARLFK
jgi:hypothetical protein